MRHCYKRCIHCGINYTYQMSGYGCDNNFNDEQYCKECKETIINALKLIPRKYEPRYRDIKEVPLFDGITLDIVLKWEKIDINNPKIIRRVYAGLIDLETNSIQNIREVPGQGNFSKYKFLLSTWPEKSIYKDYSIKIKMEYNLIKNEFTGVIV